MYRWLRRRDHITADDGCVVFSGATGGGDVASGREGHVVCNGGVRSVTYKAGAVTGPKIIAFGITYATFTEQYIDTDTFYHDLNASSTRLRLHVISLV